MTNLAKAIGGVATAALIALTAASPAEAQLGGYDYGDVVDTADIVRGVAIAGAAAAAVGAITNAVRGYGNYGYGNGQYGNGQYGNGQYGYGNAAYAGYGQGFGEQRAVDACAYQAQRYGGRVSVTDVDRRGSSSYRVRGVIDPIAEGAYNRGYERYDDYRERRSFSCTAREDGRLSDFDTDRV
jgi:hypothetical protein